MTGEFADMSAVVTGGASGIGRATVEELVARGARVASLDLRPTEPTTGVEEISADVSDEHSTLKAVDRAAELLGGIDVLINNAGIQISRPSEELSSADFDRVLAVNLRGSFMCAREALRHFIAADKPGAIVNVSSVHQLIPKPGYLGYSTSKGGMMNLTRTLALEYAGRGIRVNGIGPGATVTPINRAWIDDPVKRAQVEEHIPMRRAGDADEMAGVACFLASDLAAYITGQTIFVDGGLTLFPSFLTPWSSE
jgi:glucose 1-dehydrogenase